MSQPEPVFADLTEPDTSGLRGRSPRSAYLHIPFCRHRCGYCNFTVVAGRQDLVDSFLDALECELTTLDQPQVMDTIFWGGGTPTYLQPLQLERLIRLTRQWLPLASGGEWSSEANPLDLHDERLAQLHAAGVNRLSIGGQSFQDNKLRVLERDHSGRELSEVLTRASRYFDRVALDLIFAAPGESLAQWRSDLERACEHGISHVSTYGLTIERGSAFFGRQLRGRLVAVDEPLELAMYEMAIEYLTGAGLEHYEVSNFSTPGQACRHNETYWLGKPWLAFGPGAAGFDGRVRTVNHRSLHTYLKRILSGQSAVQEREVLSDEQLLRERFVFGLRRLAGIDLSQLACGHDLDLERLFQPYLNRAIETGLLIRSGNRVRLSTEGLMISDSLWPDFLG